MLLANVTLRGNLPLIAQPDHLFSHIDGRGLGVALTTDLASQSLYVPSRDRTITLFGPPLPAQAVSVLETMDSSFPSMTQTQKYAEFQKELSTPHLYFVNIQGTHCGSAVLLSATPLFCYGVAGNTGESLVVCDQESATALRNLNPGAYWLYRMPVVRNGALFWSTEALCSRWYRWRKHFSIDLFKCFNALELLLFDRRLEVRD